ncbi:Nucleotidylyl transferase [Pyrrhoderma noxium]|uniref:Nucleotidylyl transferase n=1 Tax=Pyrrhoderma noxium TaxID=2282107 RepID=A0A286UX62_9AGAM|nr:Nucleotidylyl transferase [Pyrrhoderma noxium]
MYKKPGLLSASHRVNMCNIAAQRESSWLMVDPWEAFQSYQRTAIVLDHFDHEINDVLGGVHTEDGEHRRVRIMLLAGSDLISTMSEPGVWSEEDLDHILGRYGCMIVERAGSDMAQATDSLAKWRHNIYLIAQMIQNDVSSTKVRLFLRRGLSVRYLLPTPVIDYIEQNGLYLDEGPNSSNAQYMQQLHRDRDREKPSSTPSPNSSTSSSLS